MGCLQEKMNNKLVFKFKARNPGIRAPSSWLFIIDLLLLVSIISFNPHNNFIGR